MNVTVTHTKSVQFLDPCYALREQLVVIVQYITDQSDIHFRTELPYPSAIVPWGYKETLEKQYLC
jgi:hypothetical protein